MSLGAQRENKILTDLMVNSNQCAISGLNKLKVNPCSDKVI